MKGELELAATIEARLAGDHDLARTLVDRPGETIAPQRPASGRALAALEALRALGASLDGKIDIHETLGEGGMGVVHLATQATLGRRVAVKTLRAGRGDVDATLRILREAWVTGALEHPNVVPVYDVGADAQGSPIIVMKRIEGQHWGRLMHDAPEIARRFSVTDTLEWNLRILVSVCNAMHFAHTRKILHRDLKPENVMIGAFGEVYVLDWGIAIALDDDPSGRLPPVSQAKDIAGTPHYMAPEMLLGDPSAYSPRTDVYLLGAIFFEIFAGRPPHEGADLNALVANILLSSPRFQPSFPAEARGICSKAMSRDPNDRYASADELRRAIEEYLRHRGSRKLAHDAKQSLTLLTKALEEAASEERDLAVANLLGECRFGYRAALSAWPENEAARRGLDRALLLVVEHELAHGDAQAAATLLREVSSPPPEIAAKVEQAARARAEQDERLRRLEAEYDPRVGTRTRTFLGGAFGLLWTISPLVGWVHEKRGDSASVLVVTAGPAIVFALIGAVAYAWAKETLTKTMLNRRLVRTLALYFAAEAFLGCGAWLADMPMHHALTFVIFSWALTQTLLAVWAERGFALAAAVSTLSFLIGAAFPRLILPLMSFDNFVLTIVVLFVWFPKQDLERMQERRRELRSRARKWLREAVAGAGKAEEE